MRLKDKIALVTGSTSGIGAATARRLAAEGATVVVHGVDRLQGESVAREIGGMYFEADLEKPSEARLLAKEVGRIYGRLDVLVNNAALILRGGLLGTDEVMFDRTIAVNLRAPLLLIQHCLPLFQASGGGSIVNIGSVNAHCGEPELLAYSISKGGLMTLTRNLADALGRENVRVNQLNIGWVLTEREQRDMEARGHPPDWASHLPKSISPTGSIFSPEQIAEHVLAFADDAGGFVSGSVVEIQQFPMIGRNHNDL